MSQEGTLDGSKTGDEGLKKYWSGSDEFRWNKNNQGKGRVILGTICCFY